MASALYSAGDLSRSKPFIVLLALATHRILHTSTWDNSFHVILRIWALAFGGLAAVEYATNPRGRTLLGAIQGAATLASIYFIALTTSILVHRGFFHRLRKFPGPFLARFSKFYGIYAGVFSTGSCYFKWQQKLHEEYGADVIRTGPREVTVYSAEAIPLIHGPLSKCKKTTLYEAFGHITGVSLNITTDKADHRQRRKIWDRAFNAKALREYEPRLNRHALALMSKLKEEASKGSVRITNWVNFYSFDVMGDVGFNRSFGMIEKGQEDDIIKLLHESMSVLSVFSHIGWALNLIGRTKAGAKTLLEHVDWSAKVLRERMQYKPKENDVFSWLLDEDDKRVTPDMIADSRLLIIAGSDTSAATLSFLVYELCLNPAVQDRLRREMDAIHPEKSHLEVGDIAECEYLEGVIYETLRLHPAVPSGPTRVTPPEGITLPDGTYIPGDVILWTPPYAYQRDPRYWEKPLSFMPERWTTENPDAIIDKRTFLTFITGPYNCIGQKLAVMQMRSVVANLVRLFDITFAEGEDGSTLEEKSQDCFTMNVGKLDVKLSPRYKN